MRYTERDLDEMAREMSRVTGVPFAIGGGPGYAKLIRMMGQHGGYRDVYMADTRGELMGMMSAFLDGYNMCLDRPKGVLEWRPES